MTLIPKPNSFVSVEIGTNQQLSYGLQLDPAPFTVSVPNEDPVLGSLEFVITNPTATALSVNSVAFTIQVGANASITPSTAGIATAVSDTTDWIVVGPPSPVTSGPATYTLQPATGSSVSLAAGESVVVQIFQIQTNPAPGNSTINIKEIVANQVGLTSFMVTTFPTGFYFDGLAVTVQSGGAFVPVAQVVSGANVTLVWNSSIVDTGAFVIYYSSASQGQQRATPTTLGEWTTPTPLTSDTVFTVVATVSMAGGQPLTASLSTAVAVQNPSLIAAAINTGQATVTGAASINGPLTANAINATSLTVQGTTTLGNQTNLGNSTMSGATILNGQSIFNGFSDFYGGVQVSGIQPNEPQGVKPSMFQARGQSLYMTWMPVVDEGPITFKVSDGSGLLGWTGSSRQFKEDIQSFSDDFHKILDAKPVSFKFKGSEDSPRSIGYIAEDFHDLGLHHLLVYNEKGEPVVIKYDRVALYQLEIIKELIRQVESLKEKVNAGLKPETEKKTAGT
jgi:Chaperone of endosialidase